MEGSPLRANAHISESRYGAPDFVASLLDAGHPAATGMENGTYLCIICSYVGQTLRYYSADIDVRHGCGWDVHRKDSQDALVTYLTEPKTRSSIGRRLAGYYLGGIGFIANYLI